MVCVYIGVEDPDVRMYSLCPATHRTFCSDVKLVQNSECSAV